MQRAGGWRRATLALGLGLACASACAKSDNAAKAGGPAMLTGRVTYLERIALPPDAQLNLRLEDVTRADVPALTIAAISIPTQGREVPLAFELPYDPNKIDSNHIYALRATLDFGSSGTVYHSTEAYRVLTRGNPDNVEIVVKP